MVSATDDLASEIATALGWPYKAKVATPTRPQGPCMLLTGDSSDATKALMEDVEGLLDGLPRKMIPQDESVYKTLLLSSTSDKPAGYATMPEMSRTSTLYTRQHSRWA